MKSDHIKRMITLTGDNIKRLSLYIGTSNISLQSKIDSIIHDPIKRRALFQLVDRK
jgi:hypothetical protein